MLVAGSKDKPRAHHRCMSALVPYFAPIESSHWTVLISSSNRNMMQYKYIAPLPFFLFSHLLLPTSTPYRTSFWKDLFPFLAFLYVKWLLFWVATFIIAVDARECFLCSCWRNENLRTTKRHAIVASHFVLRAGDQSNRKTVEEEEEEEGKTHCTFSLFLLHKTSDYI